MFQPSKSLNRRAFKKKSPDDEGSPDEIVPIEDGYSKEFFEIYALKENEFLTGFSIHLSGDDAIEKIMTYAKEKFGKELPADAEDIIRKWTGKSYRLGIGDGWTDDKWKVTDKDALDFFAQHDQHFFGKQFEHYADDLRQVVEDELSGTSRAYSSETVARLKAKMGDAFEHPHVRDYYDIVVRNAVNKSRNYGRVFRYERIGIAEIEIVAILDQKTSKMCRLMNGRRIPVSLAGDFVRDVMQTPMDEMTEKFAWPTSSEVESYKDLSTDDILKRVKCSLPPYHARCRTTTVISKSAKIKKSSGGLFKGSMGCDDKNPDATARVKQLSSLTKDELLSKMDSRIKTATWPEGKQEWPDGEYGTSAEYHRNKHKDEFAEGYDTALKNLLQSYAKVVTFNQGVAPMWIVSNPQSGALLKMNDSGTILTFYRQNGTRRNKKEWVEVQ